MKEEYKGLLMSVPAMQRKCVAGVLRQHLDPSCHFARNDQAAFDVSSHKLAARTGWLSRE
jgi:hypothetical protein